MDITNMTICGLETCQYHKFEQLLNLKTGYISYTCPGCLKKSYHSEICAFNDHKHMSICRSNHYINIKRDLIVRSCYGLDQSMFLNSEELKFSDEVLGIGGFATVNIYFLNLNKKPDVLKNSF